MIYLDSELFNYKPKQKENISKANKSDERKVQKNDLMNCSYDNTFSPQNKTIMEQANKTTDKLLFLGFKQRKIFWLCNPKKVSSISQEENQKLVEKINNSIS